MKNNNQSQSSHWDTKDIIDLKEKFEKNRQEGKSERQIAEVLKVPRSTLRDWNQANNSGDLPQSVIDFFRLPISPCINNCHYICYN